MRKWLRHVLGIEELEGHVGDLMARDEKWRRAEEKKIEARIWAAMKEETEEMTPEEKRAWEAGLDYEGQPN